MSFADKKGIVVASGFKLQAEALLDARQQVDTIAERDELVTINAATPGLRVYVKETKRNYVYNGTGWDTLAQGDGVAALPFTPSTSNTSAGVTEMLEIADEWVKNRDKLYYKLNEEGNPYNLYTLFDNRDVYAGVEGGKYQIDCSSFVHAVLMGIRYKNSRYALCGDTNEQHNSTTGYPHNISSRKWAYSLFENANDPYLQGTPQTYRYANQIAKYAYEHGFAFKITSDGKNLQYGDLIFLYENDEWDSDGYAGESWNGIYHVAIYCGKNISGYLRMVGAVSPNNSNATSPLDYTYIDPNSEYIWGAARFPLAESANVDFAERNILLGGKGDFEQTNVYKFRLTEPTKAGEWYTAVLSADRLVDATITLSLRDTNNQNVNIGYYTSSIGQPVQSKYDGLYIMSFQATKETSEVWLFSGDGNAPTSENMLLHYLCLYKGLVDPPSIYTRPQAELPDVVYTPTEFLSSESSELDGDTALEEFIRSHIDNTEFSTKLYNIRITNTTVINPGRYFTKIKVSSVGYMVVANLLGVNGHYDITIDQEDNYEIIDLRTTTTDRISDFEDAVQGLIPEIPTKLPNPQALTFTGAVTGTYDGSAAKTINIPTSQPTANSLVIKLNGGTTEGTNQFTFNGSTTKNINITPASIGAATASHGTHVTYGTDAPKANGTASAGSANSVSRSDHVHPAQTTVSGNAGSATKLATKRTIDGVSFDGTANITHFGTCSTAAGTAAKVVSCAGFTLTAGAKITVKFTTTNTAANPTLNVNNTGAKAITYRGSAMSASNLAAGRVYTFIYDGTNYELVGDININTTYNTGTASTPGLTKLYTGTGANTDGTMTQDAITDALAGKAPTSHTHTASQITDLEDTVEGLIPSKLPNPQALTFTGAVTGTYDGSAAKTINIPTTGSTDGSLIVKLNGGSTEGTNMFTFNGSADKTVNITPSAIGAAASSHSHGLASTTAAGFLKQLSGSTSQFMRADGNWATPPNTTYSAMKGATSSAAGAAGLVPAPAAGYQSRWLRGDGTWQSISLSTLGVSATAAELNYMDGVTSNVQTQLNSKAASSHTHNYAGSASAGGAANSVKASLIVKLNGGTTEGTNMFTFNGGTEKTINITPSAIGAAAASHGTHVTYSTSAPKANGTASAGSAASVSRSDHVHPLQTTVSGNAGSATKLATARTIDGVSFNGTANITHFGTCSTAAGTAAKVVSCTGFTLASGAKITVKFTVTNTAANPTLNVNNTGAKAIMYRGAAISAGYLAANRVYTFIYDGTDYELIGDINTDTNTTYGTGTSSTPGLTKLYTGTGANTDGTMTQDAITDALAAKAASSHNHSASNITSGTLPIARGGTGLTASPSMLVNLASTSAASVFATSPRPGVTGTLPIARGGTGATSASAARTALGAAASSHTHNYAGSSSAGGAATSAVKVSVPVGTVLFSTSSSTTFFSSCFGGTWTVVGNIDAIVGSSSTLTLYMFRKTAA